MIGDSFRTGETIDETLHKQWKGNDGSFFALLRFAKRLSLLRKLSVRAQRSEFAPKILVYRYCEERLHP